MTGLYIKLCAYLGVCISSITKDLNWNKHHIHQITLTASGFRTLAFISCNLHSCTINIKTTVYTTLVRPLLEYSVILYLTITGINYYGLLKLLFHLISTCICSQCDSTSLPVQRSQIFLICVLEQFKHAESK